MWVVYVSIPVVGRLCCVYTCYLYSRLGVQYTFCHNKKTRRLQVVKTMLFLSPHAYMGKAKTITHPQVWGIMYNELGAVAINNTISR